MAILISNDIRIRKIDIRNYTFEENCEIKKKDGTTKKDWVQVGGYYPNLDQTCKALKDYIVNQNVDTCTNVYELIELLTDIQAKYLAITFKVEE